MTVAIGPACVVCQLHGTTAALLLACLISRLERAGTWRGTRPVTRPSFVDCGLVAGVDDSVEWDEVDWRIRQALDEIGLPYEVVACDPALADTATFCAAYGYEPGDSANTLLIQSRGNPPRFAACVLLATNRLDVNRTIRQRLGGRKASFAGADVTVELTGMVIGGMTPVGLPSNLPLWIDRRVMGRDRVIIGAGSRNWKIIVPPAVLTKLPNAEVVEGLALDSFED